jgi:hypothetical protein
MPCDGFARKAKWHKRRRSREVLSRRHIREIAAYCESDVVNTYRVWLRYELFCGRLSDDKFQASEACLNDFMKGTGELRCQRGTGWALPPDPMRRRRGSSPWPSIGRSVQQVTAPFGCVGDHHDDGPSHISPPSLDRVRAVASELRPQQFGVIAPGGQTAQCAFC